MNKLRERGPKVSGRAARWFVPARAALAAALASLACSATSDEPLQSLTTINGVQCAEGSVACGADCAELSSSATHCGSCDNACADQEICDRSHCRPLAQGCEASLTLCNSDCVDTAKDHDHCGSCDLGCPVDARCSDGSCKCPGELSACGDACVDTKTDVQHCGSCDTACADTQTCVSGVCQCPAATSQCGETCADLTQDAKHCGSCDVACDGGQICAAGNCQCPEGSSLCSDKCVDTSMDSANCGGCGQACSGGQICDGGQCACPAGQDFCDGTCVDTQTDAAHCGSCDGACSFGQGCSAGACLAGAAGTDGCQGLASGLGISQISIYQTVETVIAKNGTTVTANPAVVAGRPSLLRVFVAPQADWVQRAVSARLFIGNSTESGDKVTTLYSSSKLSPAAASQEATRASTLEFSLTADQVTPDAQFAVELVECGGTPTGTVSNAQFPGKGGADLGALDTGGLKIHIIPMRSNGLLPDTSDAALAVYKSAFLDTYPISSIEFTLGNPIDIADATDWSGNLDTLRALRQTEKPAADVYYYGMLKPAATLAQFCGSGCTAGIGYVATGQQAASGRAAMALAYADQRTAFAMLHEVGHNHGRSHAPCVPRGATITGIDANYPQKDGSTGSYGFDASGNQMKDPTTTDVMGYCDNQWISAYTYAGLLTTVMSVNKVQASEIVSPERIGSWSVVLVDPTRGVRWGVPIAGPAVAAGDEETATVLDSSGTPIETVTVYRTAISDIDAFSVQVPAPQPGWASIQVQGAPAITF